MRLVAFSVQNYRSIKSTPRLELSPLTVLVGRNNEGKSNLLSALACALSLAQEGRTGLRRTSAARGQHQYLFERDFPVEMQGDASPNPSKFMLEFALDPADMKAFKAAVGSKLNGTLRIQFSVKNSGGVDFKVLVQGPAQRALSAQRAEISAFISARTQFEYIGAIRSEENSQEIVSAMVSRALFALEQDANYQRALRAVEEVEAPLLQSVSKHVETSLRPFLPALRSVEAIPSRDMRFRALRRSVEMWLDDGTRTPLSQKGDGVKNLAAIALAKAAAETSAGGRNLILLIEEPEAHLHSGAIHSLNTLLEEIAAERQVIISTHEPALVRRDRLEANVLVEDNRAHPAKSLDELRQALGVQLGDNLASAELVVLVEGQTDAQLLQAYAEAVDSRLTAAVRGGRLAFRTLSGAGNLPHQLRLYRSLVCDALAVLDDDEEGNNAYSKAKSEGLLEGASVFLTRCPGRDEAEIEDLINPDVYQAKLFAVFGVASLRPKGGRQQKGKWSTRVAAVLEERGKPKSEALAMVSLAKYHVNAQALANPGSCFLPELEGPVRALVDEIRSRLGLRNGDD